MTVERLAAARELLHAFDRAMRSESVEVRKFGQTLALRVGQLVRGETAPPEIPYEEIAAFAVIIGEDADETRTGGGKPDAEKKVEGGAENP